MNNISDQTTYHDERNIDYRFPRGAVPEGKSVQLRLWVADPRVTVRLCYMYGLYSFYAHDLQSKEVVEKEDGSRYHVFSLRVQDEAGLLFYWFRLECDGQLRYYVPNPQSEKGDGCIRDRAPRPDTPDEGPGSAFQITVYHRDFSTPDWLKGAVLYQIFPDRFSRDSDFQEQQMISARDVSERVYHRDWYEDVDIHGKPETGYLACDFFGGSLDGIREKVPYLLDLHIDCLYLNPIFAARSNHRYDSSDYMTVDPILGGNEAFDRLSQALKENGIRMVLDGVFSHTGADSIYFNKLGRYPGVGAYQAFSENKESEYSSWYTCKGVHNGEVLYDSWWGFPDLPNVDENDLSFRDFICGDEGVIVSWLKRGADGFRLDVSDELPDSFLRAIRKTVRGATQGEGAVIGEVWEDASNKMGYGTYRDFLFGNSHDSIMGYPFREAVLGFLGGGHSAQRMHDLLERLRDHYPPDAWYCMMNLVSSHDVMRAITALCGEPDPGNREAQQQMFLSPEKRRRGFALMRMAFVMQMCYVGAPCLYYGDEIGMEGYRDPFNRRVYPWGRLSAEQEAQLAFYREYSGLRRRWPVLRTGDLRVLVANGDAYIFERSLDDEGRDVFGKPCIGPRRVLVALNRNEHHSYEYHEESMTIAPMSFCLSSEG